MTEQRQPGEAARSIDPAPSAGESVRQDSDFLPTGPEGARGVFLLFLAVVLAEFGVMYVLDALGPPKGFARNALDAALLGVIMAPVFLWTAAQVRRRQRSSRKTALQARVMAASNAILTLSMEGLPLRETFERTLDYVFAVPWISLESRGAVFLVNANGGLTMAAQRNMSEGVRQACAELPPDKCLCGRAAATGAIVFSAEVDERHEIVYPGMAPHGHYCVPIIAGNRAIAVLTLYLASGHARRPEDDAFLLGVAAVLAGVIERTRAQERFEEIKRLPLRLLDAKDTDSALSVVLREICAAADWPYGEAWAVRPRAGCLVRSPARYAGESAWEEFWTESAQATFRPGEGLPGRAWSQRSAVWMWDVSSEPGFKRTGLAEKLGIVSALALPIEARGEVVAVLAFFSRRARHEDAAVVETAKAIAANLGIVLSHRLAEEQLIRSQKLDAVGQLAAGVAHDFNNLLTAILSYTGFVAETLNEGDRRKDDLLEVRRAGESGAQLTRQLLAFSRRQALEPRVLDLNKIIADLGKMLRRLIGEHIRLETSLAPDLRRVKADAGQIEQVLVNLAVNARDAMPGGGVLSVETENRHDPGYVTVIVRDTGCGMDESVQVRLFEPFFTTKEPGRGTGLGLATVHGIVTQSGGRISVESAPGKGSRFEILLPATGEPVAGEAARGEPRPPRGDETVLLVEDDEPVRRAMARSLRGAGYTVLEASDSAGALAAAHKHGGIRLLVTDLRLPDKPGNRLALELLSERPALKVLVVTALAEPDAGDPLSGLPGSALLRKPFAAGDLLRLAREVLDSEPRPDHPTAG